MVVVHAVEHQLRLAQARAHSSQRKLVVTMAEMVALVMMVVAVVIAVVVALGVEVVHQQQPVMGAHSQPTQTA